MFSILFSKIALIDISVRTANFLGALKKRELENY